MFMLGNELNGLLKKHAQKKKFQYSSILDLLKYCIWPNYHTYPYKHTVKQFCSLQITASVLYVYFFIKTYVVGTHLNCMDLSMQFKWVPTTCAFIEKIRKKIT